MIEQPVWDDEMVSGCGIEIADCRIAAVGGGLGSFALVDFLRITGLGVADIRVLSNLSAPYETFAARAGASQIRFRDRIRSESSATIDNIWGWPGYALREAVTERALAPLWKVVTEPLLSEFFTPRLRTVVAGLRREAARIGWDEMLVIGQAERVRRRANGGYFVLVRPCDHPSGGTIAYRCQHVHLAVGYPRPRLLPDLLAFREQNADVGQVVNCYEPHEHVYEALVRSPGCVVLRGSGIAASRILERLIRDRNRFGAQTEIIHIFRNYVDGAVGPPLFRRPGGHGFAYQPFNFPRAAFAGQLRQILVDLPEEERISLIAQMGGTTTAKRAYWERPLARARKEGWYRVIKGTVKDIEPAPSGKLDMTVSSTKEPDVRIQADALIDATGLEAGIRQHPLLADLIDVGGALTNRMGRLDVDSNFEVRGMRSGAGRLYASGAATLGCSLATVDSFSGLMCAAMEICNDLADQGACEFLGPLRSISQWCRRMGNKKP